MEPRYLQPQPVPVSGPPSALASPPTFQQANAVGPEYGTQSQQEWAHGDNKEKTLIDVVKAPHLWRLSVFGPVLVTLVYGTKSTRQITQLQAPVVLEIPGQMVVTATPSDLNHSGTVVCRVTLTQAMASHRAQARKLADATAGAVTLDEAAVSYTALTASTLTIAGVAGVSVAALSTVPLVAGAVLTAGKGFQEFEP